MTTRHVFIDGAAGTTGLEIQERLEGRAEFALILLDDAQRKDTSARKQAINDRLMLTLQNSGTTDLTGFEVYYTMTDVVTGATESYYQALDGFTLAAGATDYVYFDNQTEPGHYPENQFSLFRSSANEVDFQIQVSAQGAAVATATTVKSTGTGEAVD